VTTAVAAAFAIGTTVAVKGALFHTDTDDARREFGTGTGPVTWAQIQRKIFIHNKCIK